MLATHFALQAQTLIDPTLAARYFEEARWAAEDDGARLWGRSLDGPMVFVDPTTRKAIANDLPPTGAFVRQGNAYAGTLPPDLVVANTAIVWGDRRWTMVMWPLPSGLVERRRLMVHELWHRVQSDLGLPP